MFFPGPSGHAVNTELTFIVREFAVLRDTPKCNPCDFQKPSWQQFNNGKDERPSVELFVRDHERSQRHTRQLSLLAFASRRVIQCLDWH